MLDKERSSRDNDNAKKILIISNHLKDYLTYYVNDIKSCKFNDVKIESEN